MLFSRVTWPPIVLLTVSDTSNAPRMQSRLPKEHAVFRIVPVMSWSVVELESMGIECKHVTGASRCICKTSVKISRVIPLHHSREITGGFALQGPELLDKDHVSESLGAGHTARRLNMCKRLRQHRIGICPGSVSRTASRHTARLPCYWGAVPKDYSAAFKPSSKLITALGKAWQQGNPDRDAIRMSYSLKSVGQPCEFQDAEPTYQPDPQISSLKNGRVVYRLTQRNKWFISDH